MTLTLNDIPLELDAALRRRARADGKSLDQVALDAMKAGLGALTPAKRRDLSDLAGSWIEDPQFDQIMRDQDKIDVDAWR